ncbi:hypothetical protein [Mesorhizobium sp. M0276]|uniref:hypothetical protein n=1 Tax=Mesorhizobium sp. M0276 TaxID=2956928 RepID=UPI0033396E2B
MLGRASLVFVADCKSQCIGGAGRFRGWWPLPLHKPKQWVNARARNLVPARTGTSTTTLPEQSDRIAQISLHLGFGHIRDQDISPRKMVEEPARISTIVSYHHRAVLLTDQFGFELGNQFASGFPTSMAPLLVKTTAEIRRKIMWSKSLDQRQNCADFTRSFTFLRPHD